MAFIPPTMHCSSQHCWELLHPFAYHYQHERNNSQQSWELFHPFACSFTNTNTRNSQLLRQFMNSLNQEHVCTKYLIPHPWSIQPGIFLENTHSPKINIKVSGRALKFISSKYSPCYLCSSLHLQQSRHNKCN